MLLVDLVPNLFALKGRIHAAQKKLLIRTHLVCILLDGALLRRLFIVRIRLRCESWVIWDRHIVLLHERTVFALITCDSRKLWRIALTLINCTALQVEAGSGLSGDHRFLILNLSKIGILIVLRHGIVKFLLVHI